VLSRTDEYAHLNNIRAVDLNFGCPSPDVVKVGAGPAMLKRRKRLRELFQILEEWKRTTSMSVGAVGIKVRLGLNQKEQQNKVFLPVIETAAECGLDYCVVHARHAKQKSRDQPSWTAIKEAKELVIDSGMPIIGNGNVFNLQDANTMMDRTGCDGVMLARGGVPPTSLFPLLQKPL